MNAWWSAKSPPRWFGQRTRVLKCAEDAELVPTRQAGGLRCQYRAAASARPPALPTRQWERRRPACSGIWRWIASVATVCIGATALVAAAPADLVQVAFEQKIGAKLPLDTVVRDEAGAAHRLSDYFGPRPVVLVFGYSRCSQLCSVVANGTIEALRPLVPVAGRDYDVLYVSIDPNETPRDLAGMKARDVRRYGRGDAAGWHYVAGRAADIGAFAEAAGFRYRYDEATRQYAHPSGFVVATPQGVVSRYFLGVDFAPKELAGALRRAEDGKTGESVFELLLICARGNGVAGRYGRIVWLGLEIGVGLTVGALAWGIAAMVRQERRRREADVATEVRS